jgi:hypothetical protein
MQSMTVLLNNGKWMVIFKVMKAPLDKNPLGNKIDKGDYSAFSRSAILS